MTPLFLRFLNMSITASYLALAVMLIRGVFRKMPKGVSCLLWALVGLRLILPFSFESKFSGIPSGEVIPRDILLSETPAIHSGIPAVNEAVNPILTQQIMDGEHLLEQILSAASAVWLVGVGVLLLYTLCTCLYLHWQVRASLHVRENIYRCDRVQSPFLLGFFRPKIYLPSGIPEDDCEYVLSHENAHIRRRDHWWKPLGFLLLTVYWFNPLLWVGYILLCRDIERACDEKVVSEKDGTYRLGYAQALVDCSVHRRLVMACPVAFGEVSVKSRVKRVLRYKKPGFWLVLVSVLLCVMTAFCFLSNPKACAHLYTSETRVPATCTQMGIENRTCVFCKHSYTAPVAALSHSYDEGVVTQKPICVRTGSKKFTCKLCQDTYKEIIPATGVHTLTETVLHTATCAAAGDGIRSCSHCDYTESCSYTMLSHNWVEGINLAATCSADGFKQMVCTGCTAEQWHVTETKTGVHKWVISSTNYYNYRHETYRCSVCYKTKYHIVLGNSSRSAGTSSTNSYSGVYNGTTNNNQTYGPQPVLPYSGTKSVTAAQPGVIRIFP